METIAVIPSPLGPLTLKTDGQALTGLCFGGDPTGSPSRLPIFAAAAHWLDCYFQGRDPGPVPFPLNPQGTDFQKQVWNQLLTIPYGDTCSYGDLARRFGRMSPQAIGSAVGKNPIAILIPCHRVVGSRGQLTGYAWGLDRKQQLLRLEGRNP